MPWTQTVCTCYYCGDYRNVKLCQQCDTYYCPECFRTHKMKRDGCIPKITQVLDAGPKIC